MATSYNSASEVTSVTLGSGDGDTYQYDPNTGRMTQYSLSTGGQSLVGALTWNANGSLAEQDTTDPFYSGDTQNCSYLHDDLERVASVNCGSVWAQTFGYDAFGNITKSGSQSFLPTYSPTTNQMTTLPGSTQPAYDGDGNVTNDGANTYGWDANGNLVTTNSMTSTFDALGRVVYQTWGSQVVYPPDGLSKILYIGQTAEVGTFKLPGGGMAIISETNGVTRYGHADHLGSVRLESSTAGTFFESMAYAPYGETYAQSQFDAGLFTGEGESFSLGLYDSQTREFSDAGRWLTPDPAGVAAVDPTNPQSWNRYAYVENSPLNSVDPTGLILYKQPDPPLGDPDGGTGGVIMGNDIFDAIAGAPGTYLSIDMYGNVGFGFSVDLYIQTEAFIDNVNNGKPIVWPFGTPPYVPVATVWDSFPGVQTTSGYQVVIQSFGADTITSGLIPESIDAAASAAEFFHPEYNLYYEAIDLVLAGGDSSIPGPLNLGPPTPEGIYNYIIGSSPDPSVPQDFPYYLSAVQNLQSVLATYLPGLVTGH